VVYFRVGGDSTIRRTEAPIVSCEQNVELVLACFAAVERHDEERQRELFHPEVEFHWPPSLYGPGRAIGSGDHLSFEEVWDPFQPSEAERRMDPRVVASSEDAVVVLWQQRGIDAAGNRFECPVLGLYEVNDRKLARAQMFYFDTTATAEFLDRAAPSPSSPGAS
jgi:ketosteroid isomerase-like protein